MSPETRSAVMSRIRGKDTGPERAVADALRGRGWEFETHARDLPGRPDILFREAQVAVFVDGDFWHGWRFPVWKDKLSEKWEAKIEATRRRDARNFRKLRRAGWRVVRIWEHQVERDLHACIARIEEILPRKSRRRTKNVGATKQPGQGVRVR
ncbi:MAG: very short patch repair endonuclease [Acetobacteraceae bacterium]|nr:very short patch repair endonuclease [Acetobacteraceae bacterium]